MVANILSALAEYESAFKWFSPERQLNLSLESGAARFLRRLGPDPTQLARTLTAIDTCRMSFGNGRFEWCPGLESNQTERNFFDCIFNELVA
jgi:hypothetical protein